ncbi:hypothetical protein AT302_07825 [Pandoraea norimbergensis]|uniref:Uncharacterized protein n=1 Tax=Pandoraea norimbergensis TaxID=93219 RepID=A0ABM5WHC3_9BURK|nr:hypothetical protein AT302_07825 [Pandoraea norimbergensis]
MCFDIVLFTALARHVALHFLRHVSRHLSPQAALAFALFSTAFAAIFRVIPILAPVIPGACLHSPMLPAIDRIASLIAPFNAGPGRSPC